MAVVFDASAVRSAIKFRATYIRENIQTLTTKVVRRLIEKDLGLPLHGIDEYKELIVTLVDRIVSGDENLDDEEPETAAEDGSAEEEEERNKENDGEEENADEGDAEREKKKKKSKKERRKERKEKQKRRRGSGSEEEGEGEGPSPPKKQRREKAAPARAPPKSAKAAAVRAPPKAAKAVVAVSREQAYADRLKQLCRMASIPVPPAVYARAQGSAEELGRQLEELLGRQGLTSRSTSEEVKAVRRRLEQERDLQGINAANIVDGERRRGEEEAPRVNRYLKKARESESEGEDREGKGVTVVFEDSDEDEESSEGEEGEQGGTQQDPVVRRTFLEDSDADDW